MNTPRDHYKAADGDPVAKHTILLNYCTGDIERFCAEIKGMRANPNEVQRRASQDDVRATDFVQVFQKFKLAFNLLVSTILVYSTMQNFAEKKDAYDCKSAIFSRPIWKTTFPIQPLPICSTTSSRRWPTSWTSATTSLTRISFATFSPRCSRTPPAGF
jgi:hypothetical protein